MIVCGDSRDVMCRWIADGVKIQTCVTSPPYWGLRDYGMPGQLGIEKTPRDYVETMVEVFRLVRELLADDGTLWLNLGDSYANVGKWGGSTGGKHVTELHGNSGIGRERKDYGELKPKDLAGIPWSVAFALRADGWYLRQDIIWHKPNPMPESTTDRCTKAHEYIFLLSKKSHYYYDAAAIAEPISTSYAKDNRPDGVLRNALYDNSKLVKAGLVKRRDGCPDDFAPRRTTRNKRSVWTVTPKPYRGAHFAVFPPALIEPCILAGSRPGDTVLDPFGGSGTTGMVAAQHGRQFRLIELNPEYVKLAEQRIYGDIFK